MSTAEQSLHERFPWLLIDTQLLKKKNAYNTLVHQAHSYQDGLSHICT